LIVSRMKKKTSKDVQMQMFDDRIRNDAVFRIVWLRVLGMLSTSRTIVLSGLGRNMYKYIRNTYTDLRIGDDVFL
jgi:hypothetical protein